MIQVNNLTFKYSSAKSPAISKLDFEIQKGEIFGFLGPSGAGKSTTQKILIGLLKEFEGNRPCRKTVKSSRQASLSRLWRPVLV